MSAESEPSETTLGAWRSDFVAWVREAGDILRSHLGSVGSGTEKECASSVVTAADLAAEAHLVNRIRARFPDHGIIAEETGVRPGISPWTWVIDPLDGTSNFVAGLPWFGVQVALLRERTVRLSAMYLPATNVLYLAQRGQGAFVDGRRLSLTTETDLRRTLCAFGFDGSSDPVAARRAIDLLARVAGGVRNIRATNSLVDFCLTLEGHFGSCVNLNPRIWDVAAASLMFEETGGRFTDLTGQPLEWDLGPEAPSRIYRIAGASDTLHSQLIQLTQPPDGVT